MIVVRIISRVPIRVRSPWIVPIVIIINATVTITKIIPFIEITPAIPVANLHSQVAIVIILVSPFVIAFFFFI